MTMPNFFIIGAQKAGTTSLYHYLTQHPQVYMSPVKEPYFFDHELDPSGEVVGEKSGRPASPKAPKFSTIEEYRALFRGAKDEIAIGEASTPYIYAPGTAERIARYAPQARIIAVLRNPADRAYSAYLHAVRIGKEPLTNFAQALQEEESRAIRGWSYDFHYRSRGLYHAQLEPYLKEFGQERLGVWLYEDLRDDPTGVAQSIFRFLGVDATFVPDTTSMHNISGVPKSGAARSAIRAMDAAASMFLETFTPNSRLYPLLSRTRRRVQGKILAKPPPVDRGVRRQLIEGYGEDIERLQELLGRDLSVWLEDGKDTGSTREARTVGLSS